MTIAVDPIGRTGGWRIGGEIQTPVLVSIAYYLGAEAAFLIGTLSDRIFAPFWPPNIILMCALVLTRRRRWWQFIVAVLPAHIAVELQIGMNAEGIVFAFVSNCLVAALNAYALQRWGETPNWFETLRGAAIYVLATVIVCPALAAPVGAFVPIAIGGQIQDFGAYWVQWYASNALGAATLGPFALLLLTQSRKWLQTATTARSIEAGVVIAALIATSFLAFGSRTNFLYTGYIPALLYLPLPLIVWAAVRFGAAGASGSILLVSGVLLARSLKHGSMFEFGSPEDNVFAIQAFLIGLSVPVLLLGSAINDTRRAERATREREERMAFAAASADVGLWTYRFADGSFWATDHALRMLRLPAGRTITLADLLSRVNPSDTDGMRAAIGNAISRREPIELEFQLHPDLGPPRWLSLRARPHAASDEGSADEMSGTFADITSRKVAEREMAERQQEIAHLMRVSMLGELSGGLAHELTQPLTAILSNAEAGRMLLSKPQPNLEELAGILDDIIAADGRAGDVIHRLRALLKKGEVRYQAVDINDLIKSTLRLLHSELIGRKVAVRCQLGPGLALASGDPVQLQQVLLNLSLNAIDAMEELSPSRRILTFVTEMVRGNIEVRISDCGTGLPTSEDQIFRPFFTTKRRGLGLGLSICMSIARSHGGTLALKNNPGEGATATFRLPPHGM